MLIFVLDYPFDNNQKCDIYIESSPTTWIVVKGYFKTETSSTRARKHTMEKSTPFRDVIRLSKIPANQNRILFIYKNITYEPKEVNSWECLEEMCKVSGIVFKHITVL